MAPPAAPGQYPCRSAGDVPVARRGFPPLGRAAHGLRLSKPAVSKHVRVLEEAGLVSRDVVGREHRLSLRAQPLEEVLRWLWEAKFVEVEFREDGDGTEVVLTHGGFAGERIRDLHGEGWNGCLDNLEGLWRRT